MHRDRFTTRSALSRLLHSLPRDYWRNAAPRSSAHAERAYNNNNRGFLLYPALNGQGQRERWRAFNFVTRFDSLRLFARSAMAIFLRFCRAHSNIFLFCSSLVFVFGLRYIEASLDGRSNGGSGGTLAKP